MSKLAVDWWDFTTVDPAIVKDAAALDAGGMAQLSREGFQVVFYDKIEEFYAAEALEYIEAWKQATPDRPAGICGPIGPTEQLPIVARMANCFGIKLHDAHFWGMDEWVENGEPVPLDHPLSFAKTDLEMCFNRIDPALRMPDDQLHFPTGDLDAYSDSFDDVRCVVMQGGQGLVKHWAFNDPLPRKGAHEDEPPLPEEYRKLKTRVVDLHPLTIMQNALTSGGGDIAMVPDQAATVGPVETWKAERVSIWHSGVHDPTPLGMRLTAFMIGKRLPDSAVPMSLLADHPNVRFNYYRPAFGSMEVEMH